MTTTEWTSAGRWAIREVLDDGETINNWLALDGGSGNAPTWPVGSNGYTFMVAERFVRTDDEVRHGVGLVPGYRLDRRVRQLTECSTYHPPLVPVTECPECDGTGVSWEDTQ